MKKRIGLISPVIGIVFPLLSILVLAPFIGRGVEPPSMLDFAYYGCILASVIGLFLGIYAAKKNAGRINSIDPTNEGR